MSKESILLKKVNLSGQEMSFGEILFSSKYFQNIDLKMFDSYDEKIIALRFILCNMVCVVTNKKRIENIEKLWEMIDFERRRDHRINKELLKRFDDDNFYYYHERKAKKITIRNYLSNFQSKFLELLSDGLQELRYKVTEDEYLGLREKLVLCIKLLFKTTSEYGLIPVIRNKNLHHFQKFYKSFPELADLNISQMDSSDVYFNMMWKIWTITKDTKILADLDIAFERMKNSKGLVKGNIVEDNLESILKDGYVGRLPYFERFKNTKNYLQFTENNVFEWSLDINTLKKWSVGEGESSLSHNKITAAITWIENCDLFSLELFKPLKNIYIDYSKTNICFIFNKNLIKNDIMFESYWLRIIELIFSDDVLDNRELKIETIDKEFLLELEIPEAKNLNKSIIRKF